MSKIHDFVAKIIKHNIVIQKVYTYGVSFILKIFGVFIQNDKNIVLISSYGGDRYNDSPRVLFEAMISDDRFKKLKYVWAFTNPNKYLELSVKKVKIDTPQYFYYALKASVWITNVNIERGLHFKKRDTIYLNTWHGTGPKKGGNAVRGRSDYDFSNVDILCVDGEYQSNIMKKWFGAEEKSMVWCGRPREDELFLFKPGDKKIILKKLEIPINKKVILYMPTWREWDMPPLDIKLWEKELGTNYVFLIRQHHFSTVNICDKSEFIYDVSTYDNVNELYFVADILISDYSSAFFDYGLLGKPMICYAYDYEKYVDEYGLFIDLKRHFPNGVMNKEQEVISFIKNIDYLKECEKCRNYCNKIIHRKGNATQTCLNKLYKLMTMKEK